MSWISVYDELPKESNFYICQIDEIHDLGRSVYTYKCYYNKEKEFNKWIINGKSIHKVIKYMTINKERENKLKRILKYEK